MRRFQYARTALLAVALCACHPKEEGADQVPNSNITNTAQKDQHWDYAKNSYVDGQMTPLLEKSPGCAVGVMVDSQVDYLHGYGWRDRSMSGGDTRVYTEMGFNGYGSYGGPLKSFGEWNVGTTAPIGSVSKVYTALAAMKITEDDVDWSKSMTVDDVLDDTGTPPAVGNYMHIGDVTLRKLLAHKVGVGVEAWGSSGTDRKGEAFAPNFNANALTYPAPPGVTRPMAYPRLAWEEYKDTTKVSTAEYNAYSNVGYGVVGAMIDEWASVNEATYDGYESYVWARVGQPYGNGNDARNMRSLALMHSWRQHDIPRLAYKAHTRTNVGSGTAPTWSTVKYPWDGTVDNDSCLGSGATYNDCQNTWEGWEGPAGGWTMNIGDLTRLGVALDNDVIVSGATLDDMHDYHESNVPGVGKYGLGFALLNHGDDDASKGFFHHGLIGNNMATFWYWPAQTVGEEHYESMTVAMQCNGFDTSASLKGSFSSIAQNIRAHYEDEDYLGVRYVPGYKWLPKAPKGTVNGLDLNGQLYALELGTAHITSPYNLWLPLEFDGNIALLQTTQTSKGSIQTELGLGTVNAAGVATQDPDAPVLDMGIDTFKSNPQFSGSHSGKLVLPMVGGDATLEQPKITVYALPGGSDLVAMQISGQLDLRTLTGSAAEHADICDTWGVRGTCEPCDDGVLECLSITISDISADEVSGSLSASVTGTP